MEKETPPKLPRKLTLTWQPDSVDSHGSFNSRRSTITKPVLPVQGEVLASEGEASELSCSVTNLFKKYAIVAATMNNSARDNIKSTSLKRRNMRALYPNDHSESELFMELIYDIQHELNVDRLCFKIMYNIAVLTNCDRCSLFLTRNDGEENVLVCKLFDLKSGSKYEDVCKAEDDTYIIPFGKGVLGHVAESKQFVKIDNAYEDERFNRAIDEETGYRTYSILCMPIMDSESNVVGVAQIINKSNVAAGDIESHVFSEQDVLVFRKYLMFCGIGITNAQLFQLSMHEYRCNQLLLNLAQSIFKENTSLEKLMEQIMTSSMEIVNCETCHTYLCSQELDSGIPFTQEFILEKGVVRSENLDHRQSNERGLLLAIADHVKSYGQTFAAKNIADLQARCSDADILLNPAAEAGLKSVICTPIKNADGTVIAVGQLVNKSIGVFTISDIQAFEGFVIYCGLGIQNTRMYENINRMNNFQKVCLEMLSYHATSQEAEIDEFEKKKAGKGLTEKLLSPGFHVDTITDSETVTSIVFMFSKLALSQTYNINKKTLLRWILSVKKNYRNVEFHNWRHAFSVMQTMFWLLLQKDIGAVLSPLEKLTLIIACLCHDIDHRGTNNAFQKKTNHPLAALNDSSTLEHHHLNMALLILNTNGNNILESLPSAEYSRSVILLKHCILATDLALHFKCREEWKSNILPNLSTVDWTVDEFKLNLMSMLMTAADLSASAKPWDVQLATAAHIAEEFYQQGDKEQSELNAKPMLMMNRQHHDKLAQNQKGFFDGISLPVYSMLSEAFHSVKLLRTRSEFNRENWAKLAEQPSCNDNNELGVIGAVDKMSIMADFDSTSRDYHLAYSPQNSYDCLVKDDSNDTGYQSPRHVPYKQNISDLSLQSVQSNSCTCSIM